MAAAEKIITDNLEIWSTSVKDKSAAGRGTSKKIDLYGIKKLRELILELAVRGLLVDQDSDDEPASVLLDKIKVEKVRLLAEGKLKKKKIIQGNEENEAPYKLPKGWLWVKLGDISSASTGYAFKSGQYVDSGTFVLRVTNIEPGGSISQDNNKYILPASAENEYKNFMLANDDILLVMVGGSLGKVGVVSKSVLPAVLNQNMWKFSRYCEMPCEYLVHGLKYINANQITITKSTHGHLAQGDYLSKPFPLPPLAEQHRIVAKVDELMSLCDQLEQQQENSITVHKTLVETLLVALTNAANKGDFSQAWLRVAEHFNTLFTTEDSIDQLKKTILQLAVMGKLIPQNPNNESAFVLLENISVLKKQLIADKKIKKQKDLPGISEDENMFELPQGWAFSYLEDLCELITDGTHQTPKYTDSGRPFISAQCVKPFLFKPEKCRYVSEEHYQNYIKNRKPEYKDILLARVGAGIGEAALIDTELEFAIYVSTGLLKPFKEYMSSEYLVVWLNSPIGRGYSERNTYGKGVSQGNLNLSLIRSFLVSIPPLAEQKLIVTKVNELQALCEKLKDKIDNAQITQLHLADAITEQAVNT